MIVSEIGEGFGIAPGADGGSGPLGTIAPVTSSPAECARASFRGRNIREFLLPLLDERLPAAEIEDGPIDPLLIDELERFQPLDFGLQRGELRVVTLNHLGLAVSQEHQGVVAIDEIKRDGSRPEREQEDRDERDDFPAAGGAVAPAG